MSSPNRAKVYSNEYDGYAAGVLQRAGAMRLMFEFNARIVSDSDSGNSLDGFSLRIMERREDVGHFGTRTEFGVMLTEQEWQELINRMTSELDRVRWWRKKIK